MDFVFGVYNGICNLLRGGARTGVFLMGINHVNAHYKLEYNLYRFSYIYIYQLITGRTATQSSCQQRLDGKRLSEEVAKDISTYFDHAPDTVCG